MRGSSFFEDVGQVDIEIGGEPGKTPTFYYDGRSMTVVFAARYRSVRELMPDPCYVPARLAPGLGLLAISCLEYRDTDIGAYNELLIGVPLNEPPFRLNLPVRALVSAARQRQQPSFVWQLPVTTEIALRGGVDFYNFPKFIGDIAFSESRAGLRCRLAEGEEHILTVTGEQIPGSHGKQVDHFLRLWMDGQPQAAQFRMNQLELSATRRPGAAVLELGERHPIAVALRRLLVSLKPLQYEYCPRFEAILFGPEHTPLPLTRRGLQAIEALEQRELAH